MSRTPSKRERCRRELLACHSAEEMAEVLADWMPAIPENPFAADDYRRREFEAALAAEGEQYDRWERYAESMEASGPRMHED